MASSLDLIFSALSDPTRRQILTLLLEDDMAVTDVAEPFEMSLAAISKHLAVLTNAGLIQQERRGRVKWCKLDPDAMQAAWAWMQGFGHFDALDLDGWKPISKRHSKIRNANSICSRPTRPVTTRNKPLVTQAGFEPATCPLGGGCSIQLSH